MGPMSPAPSAAAHSSSYWAMDSRAAYHHHQQQQQQQHLQQQHRHQHQPLPPPPPPHGPSAMAVGCCPRQARGAATAADAVVKSSMLGIGVDVTGTRSWPGPPGALLDPATYSYMLGAAADWCSWCQMCAPRAMPAPMAMQHHSTAHEAALLGASTSLPLRPGVGGLASASLLAGSWPGVDHVPATAATASLAVEAYPLATHARMGEFQPGPRHGDARGTPNGGSPLPHLPGHGSVDGHGTSTPAHALEPRPSTKSGPARFRGPPRKPRRSGYALWVGNLPHPVHILQLRDYFATGASAELESVFFMSRSNCAFVNYRTEAACVEAAERFRNANFNGARLTCRVRNSRAARDSSPVAQRTPTPSSASPSPPSSTEAPRSPVIVSSTPVLDRGPTPASPDAPQPPPRPDRDAPVRTSVRGSAKDRFFILKSLTGGDLDWSVRNGMWATQPHNEKKLNEAFKTSANVYLIFSTNKSGHFYGYARMVSAIAERWPEPEPEPTSKSTSTPDSRITPTAATALAPAGRVVDDAIRGTLYWEIISDTESPVRTPGREGGIRRRGSTGEASSGDDADGDEGKPFEVAWLRTQPLPFIKTRGLQNSYNAHKEVKVARDGTEVEPSVGRRLLRLFDVG